MKKEKLKKLKEVLNSLDSYRKKIVELNKEQMDFVDKCRNHKNPVSFQKISELLYEIWGVEISDEWLRRKYLRYIQIKRVEK